MRTRLLWLTLSLLGCGGNAALTPDAFKGYIDGTVLDAKFLPARCASGSCYPSQAGYVHGAPISFYNVGSLTTSTLPPLKAANAPKVYTVTNDQCSPVEAGDPLTEIYPSSAQFPLFTTLPLASRVTGVTVLPFVTVLGTGRTTSFTCNAVKTAASVGTDQAPGKFGLQASSDPGQVRLWAVVDPTAPLAPATADFTLTTSYGWYNNLLLTYLDGGPVPTSATGELQAMDGVILDPAGVTTFAKATDPKVVLLPFKPGEAGYSPIVKLHSWRLPAGKVPGDFTGICTVATSCGPKDVNLTQAAASPFNTILIVTQ
jgi:hypothetical protein